MQSRDCHEILLQKRNRNRDQNRNREIEIEKSTLLNFQQKANTELPQRGIYFEIMFREKTIKFKKNRILRYGV